MLEHTEDCFRPAVCASLEPCCGVRVQDRDHKIKRSAECLDEVGEEEQEPKRETEAK